MSPRAPESVDVPEIARRIYPGLFSNSLEHFRLLCSLAIMRLHLGAATKLRQIMARAATIAHSDIENLVIAAPLFRFALETMPDDPDALLALGTICISTGQIESARSFFTRSIGIGQTNAAARVGLGSAESRRAALQSAAAFYAKALMTVPDQPGILTSSAILLQQLGRTDGAITLLKRAISKQPDNMAPQLALGNIYYAAGHDSEAVECYLSALQTYPREPEVHNNLANVLLRQGHLDRAVAHYRTAIDIKPDYADAHGNLGNALLESNRLDESIAQNRRALALKPTRYESYNNLGIAYQALGQFAEATTAFELALQLAPDEAPAHLNLANMAKFAPNDRRLPQLKRLLAHVDQLDTQKQIAAHFAMAKALSDLGDHDDAFGHLKTANRLKRSTFVYDGAQQLAAFRNLSATFSREFIDRFAGCGDPSWSPIFIVGMPRSGTTLIEQVLASHSQIFGAGELETFKSIVGQCLTPSSPIDASPDLVTTLSREQITDIGQAYTKAVQALAPDAQRIADKMPLNFMFVGLIHLALPKAKIIHMRRDPLDNCVSCFSLLFAGQQPFAYDLAELGHYYRGYEAVMDHWRAILPPDVMIDVRYEDLVDDLPGVAGRVLAHCGLDWEDTCRDFQVTQRPVRTASLMQVRQPLFRTSVGSWRRYDKFLGPLRKALAMDSAATP